MTENKTKAVNRPALLLGVVLVGAFFVAGRLPAKPSTITAPPPATSPAPRPTITPAPTARVATFREAGSLTAPSLVNVGDVIVLTVSVRNTSVRGAPWFTITGLTDSAPLIGCTPKCIDHGGGFGVDVLQFSRLDADATKTYTMRFQAQHLGAIDYAVTVSGWEGGLPYPAGDVFWTLTTTVLLG